ncbi:MAG: hypothetical protein KatS3mg009_3318 [Acidimicrobiia bacterium]|nr:MAG: hypothetical protein KatS3mg009_3318 [Acidimicrobiia bacterium]
MWCAFEGKGRIVRISGRGRVHELGSPRFAELAPRFPSLPGARSIIEVEADRIATSCGDGVPLMDFVGHRDRLLDWARAKGEDGLRRLPRREERGEHRRAARALMRYAARIARARERMAELDVDVLLLSVGADLPYLTGYEAMPLERLTMFVLPREGDAKLVVPRLEAPRVAGRTACSRSSPWEETDDPVAIVARIANRPARAAIGDRTWARFLLALEDAMPATVFSPASEVLGPLRAVKDEDEIEALRAAAAAVDAHRRRAARRARSRGAPSSTCTGSWSSGCSPRATSARTSRSSPPASTRRARTTSRRRRVSCARATSCCATSAGRCAGTAPTSPGCSTSANPAPR